MKTGSTLGPYQIQDKLGEGGMGEVYLAVDPRLGRTVAIKVLPEAFATDAERLARFSREARAAAALNHPHIAAIHDIGVEGEIHYLVQEHLEGMTVRGRLDAGPIPLTTALTLGAEIAEALAAAHAAGIVHRDLKPDNVFVTEQGHAKVLDFGLAKLTAQAAARSGSEADLTRSPTILGTSAGQIMGTAGYMAPEQITGEEVDGRADVFAFGCLLYELVSGKRAFSGRNLPEILHRLANDEPDPLLEVAPGLPAEGRRIVMKCLAKEPGRRYQGMADVVVDLRRLIADIDAGRAVAEPVVAVAAARPFPVIPVAVAAVAGLLVGAVLYAGLAGTPTATRTENPTTYLPLEGVPGLDNENPAQIAISPDGRYVGFATGTGPVRLIDLQSEEGARALPETDGGAIPFFAPDSRSFAYLGPDTRLYRVPVEGGRPLRFSEPLVEDVHGLRWLPSGEVLVATQFTTPMSRIPDGGNVAESFLEVDPGSGEMGHGTGAYLPDGRRLLYAYWDDRWRIGVRDLEGGPRIEITEGYAPRYVPTGHLVWILAEQMMAARFDVVTLELGEPVQFLSNISSAPGSGRPGFDFSDSGNLVYLRGPERQVTNLIRVDEDGTRVILHRADRRFVEIAYSPTGDRLALNARVEGDDSVVLSYDLERDDLAVVGQADGWDQYPFFSPTGDRIGFLSERLGDGDVFVRPADGSGSATPLAVGEGYPARPTWTNEGRIVYQEYTPERGSMDILMFSPEEPETLIDLVATPANESGPMFSRDGNFLAYASDRSGRKEVYVAAAADGVLGAEWKVTTGGGSRPRWTRDARRLYYWSAGTIWRVDIIGTNPFRAGPPAEVATAALLGWDVAPDGSHVVIVDALEPPRPRLVLNWFAELERRLPRDS